MYPGVSATCPVPTSDPQEGCGEGPALFSGLGHGSTCGVMCGEPLLRLTFALLSSFTHRAVQALRPGLEFLISFRGCFWKYWLVWGGNCHCHGCLELSPRTSGQVFPLGGKGARVGCAPFGLPSAPVAG